MRWRGRQTSSNVEDRRGMGPALIGGGGVGALVIALLVIFLGGDPSDVVQSMPTQSVDPNDPEQQEAAQRVGVVLKDTEDVWNQLLPAETGQAYVEPKLVLFSGAVESACGTASSAVGPFYCPLDSNVYIDLSFYQQLEQRFGAPGDFAEAYVVAHEVGHHVQNLLGIAGQVQQMRQQSSQEEGNALQVRMELQADCLAGVWAYHANQMNQILEPGDIEEALNAASAIGDDTLQRRSQGHIVPESFTHGTSAQRSQWFRAGFNSGDVDQCDTFGAGAI
ncbi:MAG: zinc metallopeptidase [Acidobacteria bacterium]|nr:zinc metallopeptidase [Acidobacteriota bacterium]